MPTGDGAHDLKTRPLLASVQTTTKSRRKQGPNAYSAAKLKSIARPVSMRDHEPVAISQRSVPSIANAVSTLVR